MPVFEREKSERDCWAGEMIQCEEIKAWFIQICEKPALAVVEEAGFALEATVGAYEITHPAVQQVSGSVSSPTSGSIRGKLLVSNPSVSQIAQECCGHVEMTLTAWSSRRYTG